MGTTDIGDKPRLKATITDINGDAADPSTVTFEMTEPDGTTTTYVYGTDPQVSKESTGIYYVDWPITQQGVHYYRFTGSGNVVAAEESSFTAPASNIR